MDDVMRQLDEMLKNGQLSEVSHGVLRKLAKKRRKERFWFRIRNANALLLGTLYLIVIGSLESSLRSQHYNFHLIMNWLMTYWHFMIVFLIVFGHLALKITADKFDEMDGKYDRLRKEIVDREEEIWNRNMEDRLSKPTVLKLFDKKDVNLFHK